jgi:hypothetical protein
VVAVDGIYRLEAPITEPDLRDLVAEITDWEHRPPQDRR